jgi:hypothetical protein
MSITSKPSSDRPHDVQAIPLVAMLGSLNHVIRELIAQISPTKRSSDLVAHLNQIDALYGPVPGRASKPVVLVEDNGPIHVSKLSRAALVARAHWLTVE